MVLVRLATGGALLAVGWQRIRTGADAWLVESTAERIATAPAPFAWWGQKVLLGSPGLFAQVFCWGAFAAGVGLFLGVLVRPAAALAVALLVHVYFAGPPHRGELALLLGLCALACALARAGRRVGIDASLEERLPAWLTWVR